MDHEGFEDVNLEEISKFVQRVGAVGYLPKNLDVVNKILTSMGVDTLDENANLDELLPDMTSKAGDGMEEGMPSGTGKATGKSGDGSSTNSNNKA
jgi:hypothetical protein